MIHEVSASFWSNVLFLIRRRFYLVTLARLSTSFVWGAVDGFELQDLIGQQEQARMPLPFGRRLAGQRKHVDFLFSVELGAALTFVSVRIQPRIQTSHGKTCARVFAIPMPRANTSSTLVVTRSCQSPFSARHRRARLSFRARSIHELAVVAVSHILHAPARPGINWLYLSRFGWQHNATAFTQPTMLSSARVPAAV
jgi:hypothetical protein